MDYFETGFAVREASWHAKETLLDVAPTIDTWRQAAGLEWEPVKVPLYLPAPIVAMNDDGSPVYGPAQPSGSYAMVRNDRIDTLYSEDPAARDTAVLARAVSEDFQPIEHERDMTPLLEAVGQACQSMGVGWEFTTAGSVRNGKQVYACLMLDRPLTVGTDDSLSLPFGVLVNSHDGTGSCRGGLTVVRVVCANTYAMAEADMDGHGLDFRIAHVGDVAERLEQARVTIGQWLDAIEAYESMAKHLVAQAVTAEQQAEWVSEFLPVVEHRMTDRQVANRRTEQALFTALLDDSVTLDGIRGTAFGLWQGTIEFMDHLRPHRSADSYLRRTMLEAVPAKTLARDRILELVGAN